MALPDMSIKAWVAGVFVALGVVGGYLAHCIGGTEAPPSKWGVTCAPAWAIFEQKRRCGHIDLGYVVVTGTVVRTKTHNDGDFSINIIPDDPKYLYYGGLRNRDYIHAEFMPCERVYPDVENVLQDVKRRHDSGENLRVEISGRWSFDGVDHRGGWQDELKNCLETRNPDPSVGWIEVHPAYKIRILD